MQNGWEGAKEAITVSDLRSANRVVAAQLHSHAHEYMEHMVKSYLCSARERFEQSKNVSFFPTDGVYFACHLKKGERSDASDSAFISRWHVCRWFLLQRIACEAGFITLSP